jgi:hypothetical protein
VRISIAVLFVTLITASLVRAEVSGDDILAKVRPAHPRLMMTDGTLATLKDQLSKDPWLRGRYANQKKLADQLLAADVSKYEIPDGKRLLATSRRVLERVTTLAIVYRIEGDRKYLDRCWAELDAAAHFKDWNPPHFLDTAEMTAAFAIGYDWLYDAWTAEQRMTLRDAILKLGLAPAIDVYDKKYSWWPSSVHNWNIVCNGGVSMGALAIAGDVADPAQLARVLGEAIKSAPRCLKEFAPDGAWSEGPSYWGYTTNYESMYLDSLQTACGTDFGLGDVAGVEKGGWFPAYLNGPTGSAYNFADAGEGKRPEAGPQLLWMARRFNEPRYAQYQIDAGTGRLMALELIWGAGIERKPWATIDTDRWFRRSDIATMRDNWTDPEAWFVAFKAGSNAVNHSHLDVGSFVVEAKGVRWAVDLSSDDYNLPGYFGDQRWNYYRLRAEAHNTLVINPSDKPDQNPKGAGAVTSFVNTSSGVSLTADLTGVYPATEKVTRTLAFTRGKSLAITDRVELKQPGEIDWFLSTRADAQLSSDGRSVTLTQKGQTLQLKLIEPAAARFSVAPAGPLSTSPHPPKQAANPGVSRIAIRLTDVKDANIQVRFED